MQFKSLASISLITLMTLGCSASPMATSKMASVSADRASGSGDSTVSVSVPVKSSGTTTVPLAAATSAPSMDKAVTSEAKVDGAPVALATEAPIPSATPVVEVKSGLLTAAEWNDLAKWSFWLDLLGEIQWQAMESKWGFHTSGRIPVMVKKDGNPVIDAKVSLKDATEQIIYQARTNNKGQAELFSNIFVTQNEVSAITVESKNETVTEKYVKTSVNEPFVINMKQNSETSRLLDIMFMVDTTGSMGDELMFLKSEVKNVIEKIKAANTQQLEVKLSCNYYRDHGDDYVIRSFPLTYNINEVIEQLSSQSAGGGGDTPEAVDEALQDAVDKHEWSENAVSRILFLILDAPPHYNTEIVERLHQVTLSAAKKGIRIIPITGSGIDKDGEFLLRFMGIATGGRYTFLTDDSGIGGSHMKPTIGSYKVEKLNDLLVRIVNEYTSVN